MLKVAIQAEINRHVTSAFGAQISIFSVSLVTKSDLFSSLSNFASRFQKVNLSYFTEFDAQKMDAQSDTQHQKLSAQLVK